MEADDALTASSLRLHVAGEMCAGEMVAYWVTLRLHAFVSDWKVVASAVNGAGREVTSMTRQLPRDFDAEQISAAMEGMLREMAAPL